VGDPVNAEGGAWRRVVDVIPRSYGAGMRREDESGLSSARRRPARRAKTGWVRAITYRMYPTAGQRQALLQLVACQRDLYNAALEERRGAWRWERRQVTLYEQFGQLSGDR